jgi:FtsH-binding integral membrane protein
VKGSCFVLLQKVADMGVGDFQAGFDNDIEKGFGQTPALYPGIGADENTLRWGFIRKVYGILSVQFVLTTVVAGFVVLSTPVSQFFQANPISIIILAFLPLILLCPLYAYQQSHPLNLILLGLFTVSISLTVGISCSLAPAGIVLEALLLTAIVVVSLTAYTYWAAKNGYDFSFLGPILFTSLIVIVLFGLVQAFFPLGPISQTIYGGLTALLFSAYIVYDTDNLIKRYTYDEFIWASVALYLDVLNLFLSILQVLRSVQSSG